MTSLARVAAGSPRIATFLKTTHFVNVRKQTYVVRCGSKSKQQSLMQYFAGHHSQPLPRQRLQPAYPSNS